LCTFTLQNLAFLFICNVSYWRLFPSNYSLCYIEIFWQFFFILLWVPSLWTWLGVTLGFSAVFRLCMTFWCHLITLKNIIFSVISIQKVDLLLYRNGFLMYYEKKNWEIISSQYKVLKHFKRFHQQLPREFYTCYFENLGRHKWHLFPDNKTFVWYWFFSSAIKLFDEGSLLKLISENT